MNYLVANTHQILNSCIEISESKICRRLTMPSQIVFRLNADLLQQIELLKAKNQQLKLSQANLANLRYYTLLNSPLETKSNFCNSERSPLNFSTNYLFSDEQHFTVIRTLINLEGHISQQIHQDLWHNPQLFKRILNAHHWLIRQILMQLPLKLPNYLLWILKILPFLIWAIVSFYIWYFSPLNSFLTILIICSSFYLSKKYLITLIKQQGKIWLTKALFSGFLAKTTHKRQIALSIFKALA